MGEYWSCPALRARLTEGQCELNAARALKPRHIRMRNVRGYADPMYLRDCLECQGVRALAASGQAEPPKNLPEVPRLGRVQWHSTEPR